MPPSRLSLLVDLVTNTLVPYSSSSPPPDEAHLSVPRSPGWPFCPFCPGKPGLPGGPCSPCGPAAPCRPGSPGGPGTVRMVTGGLGTWLRMELYRAMWPADRTEGRWPCRRVRSILLRSPVTHSGSAARRPAWRWPVRMRWTGGLPVGTTSGH